MNIKYRATSKELFYDRFSGQWEDKINDRETKKRLNIVFGRLLKPSELKNKKFLEVGCGLGYFSNRAYKLGAKVTGIDTGPNLIKINKKKTPNAKFLVASASRLPLKDNSFDIVLSTEVIEHVEDQERSIKEMIRVLKKGGILVITTPNRLFKPFFDFLTFVRIRPYRGNEKWFYPWVLKRMFGVENVRLISEYYFNFIYPGKLFDKFENGLYSKYLCINYAFKFKKT